MNPEELNKREQEKIKNVEDVDVAEPVEDTAELLKEVESNVRDIKEEELKNPEKIASLKEKIEEEIPMAEAVEDGEGYSQDIKELGDILMREQDERNSHNFIKQAWDNFSVKGSTSQEKDDNRIRERVGSEKYEAVKKYIHETRIAQDKAENPEQWDENGNFVPKKVSLRGMIKKTFGGQ